MIIIREEILARLLDVIAGVDGILAVVRNGADVPLIRRPMVRLEDGKEEFLDKPGTIRHAQIQRMELTPGITIHAGADSADVGTLLNLLWARLVPAIANDATLQALVGTKGQIHYAGKERLQAGPESKEGRMEVTFVFVYVLKLTDLV